jgi:PAS domain S-box-containing protein
MDDTKKPGADPEKELKKLQLEYDQLLLSYEKDITARKLAEEKLLNRTTVLSFLNKYSIELAEHENESINQFIITSLKSFFKVREVLFLRYNEKTSELVLESSTITRADSSKISKYLGHTMKNLRTRISDKDYRLILESGTKVYSSFHEISFGHIPVIVGSAIEKIFNIGWFQGIALIDKGKLIGTLIIVGYKKQTEIEPDLLKMFSELTSNTLRRKETEYKLQISEDKFRKAFITSPDSININRLYDGMYISINKGFAKITGYTEDIVIGKTTTEINIWADQSERDRMVNELKEKGEVNNFEARFLTKDGLIRTGIMFARIIDFDGLPHVLSITRDITERKIMETELRDSEIRFGELIELAPDGILLGAHDGTIKSANSRIQSITGRTLKELIGMNISLLFSDHELNSTPLRYDLLEKDETVTSMRNIKRPDGSISSIEMHTKAMPDGSYMSICHDITKRKLVEEALIKSKEQYDDLVNKIPVGIYILRSFRDGAFVLDYLSSRMAEMVGSGVEELLSDASKIYEQMDDDDRESFVVLNQEGLKLCKPFDWSGRVKYNGTIKWLHISSVPEPQKNGDILWHGIVVDITEQKLAEKSLVDNERLLRASQNIARLGSFVWDLSTGLWKSSAILDDIFGIDENFIRSFEGWLSIIHPEFRATMADYVTIEILGKHQKFDKEYRIERITDNQIRWVQGLGELEFDKNNKPIKLTGTIIDITDRKRVEDEINKLNTSLEERVNERTAQLEDANSELQAFAYSVSHDLRAPLRAIDGFSKFVIEDYGPKLDAEGQRLLGLIRSNTQKMDRLITDILSLSRVTRGEQKKSRIDMTKMARSMLSEAALPETKNRFDFIIDELPETYADPSNIKQVWINLISNAIKFSSLKNKPEIRIGGRIEKEYNVYFVNDNGVGFNMEYADKLFGVFQRLHKANEFEGNGVGLAIVQRIIHRHGGKVWAEGKEDKGATFYFSLPRDDRMTGNQYNH